MIWLSFIDKTKPPYLSKRSALVRRIKQKQLDSYLKKVDKKKAERAAKKNEEFDFEGELMTEEQFDEAAGEKDACYHKVKSRYSVCLVHMHLVLSSSVVKLVLKLGNKSKK